MINTKMLGIVLSVVLLIYATSSYACIATKDELNKAFKKADVNHDGVLSEDEYFNSMLQPAKPKSQWHEIFSRLDKNSSGSVSHDEYDPWMGTTVLLDCV